MFSVSILCHFIFTEKQRKSPETSRLQDFFGAAGQIQIENPYITLAYLVLIILKF